MDFYRLGIDYLSSISAIADTSNMEFLELCKKLDKAIMYYDRRTEGILTQALNYYYVSATKELRDENKRLEGELEKFKQLNFLFDNDEV